MANVTKVVDPNSGAGFDYASLAALVSGYAKNLVTATEVLTIDCRCTGGTADGACTFNGFTTSSTYTITITANAPYRHGKTYATGNIYRIESTDASALVMSDTNVKIYGLEISVSASGTNAAHGITYTGFSGGEQTAAYCLIKASLTTTTTCNGIACTVATLTYTLYNNVIYGFVYGTNTHNGINSSNNGTVNVYNCTVFGNRNGFRQTNGTVTVKNCVSANNNDDFSGTFSTIDYCASDDGDGTNQVDWANEGTDWGNVFTDYANGDFSLKNYTQAGIKVIGVGVDNPGSGLYSDDIIGTSRSSTWDIGAFEYVAAGGALSGSVSGNGTFSGTLTGKGKLEGSAVGNGTFAGTLKGNGKLEGVSTSSSTFSSTLKGTGALIGSSSSNGTFTGVLTGRGSLTGVSNWQSTFSGALDVPPSAFVGSFSASSVFSGVLTGQGKLEGSIPCTSTFTSELGGRGNLEGSSSSVATLDGVLQGIGRLAGVSNWQSTFSCTPQGTGKLAGTTNWLFTFTGVLKQQQTTSSVVGGQANVGGWGNIGVGTPICVG